MEVKHGYKNPEVGELPQDWRAERLNRIVRAEAPICYGILMPGEHQHQGVPVIRVKDILEGRIEESRLLHTHPSIDEAYKRSRLFEGDILITIRGTTGRTALVTNNLNGANITQDTARLRINSDISNHFVYYALQSHTVQQQVVLHTIGQAVKGINICDVRNLLVPLPAGAFEQRAIATALSDVDALLGALERLITKKRDLKQAAMQQLLTGKRRLPGFSGEWEGKPLASEIADLEAGISVNSVEDVHSGLELPAILKTSAVSNGTFIPSESKAITPRDLGRVKLSARANSVIISRMNTIDLVGECGYVPEDYPNLYVPDRLWMTRFNASSRVSAKWLAFVLSTPMSRQLLRSIATGTSGSMKNIAKGQFLGLEFAFPHPEEQKVIAGVLTDMDAELTALEQRLAKTRDIKQGMMQELLTGRTRLFSPQEAHA